MNDRNHTLSNSSYNHPWRNWRRLTKYSTLPLFSRTFNRSLGYQLHSAGLVRVLAGDGILVEGSCPTVAQARTLTRDHLTANCDLGSNSDFAFLVTVGPFAHSVLQREDRYAGTDLLAHPRHSCIRFNEDDLSLGSKREGSMGAEHELAAGGRIRIEDRNGVHCSQHVRNHQCFVGGYSIDIAASSPCCYHSRKDTVEPILR